MLTPDDQPWGASAFSMAIGSAARASELEDIIILQ